VIGAVAVAVRVVAFSLRVPESRSEQNQIVKRGRGMSIHQATNIKRDIGVCSIS